MRDNDELSRIFFYLKILDNLRQVTNHLEHHFSRIASSAMTKAVSYINKLLYINNLRVL